MMDMEVRQNRNIYDQSNDMIIILGNEVADFVKEHLANELK
jgi:hypothetical protein